VLAALAPQLRTPGQLLALGAAMGGATANTLDRLRRGAVVDFLDLGCWPVFNLADVAITFGAGFAALALL
jgi:signal peptidase II